MSGKSLSAFIKFITVSVVCVFVSNSALAVNCSAGYYLPQGSSTCTLCKAKHYCLGGNLTPSSTADVGTTSCPAVTKNSGAVMAASDYPASWYSNEEGSPNTLWEVKIQEWSQGLKSITECRAVYTFENKRGILRNEGLYYKDGYYKKVGEYAHDYYLQINPGYFAKKMLYDGVNQCSSSDYERNMLYQEALPCPSESYCPGFTADNWGAMGMPRCDNANYIYNPDNDPDEATLGINPYWVITLDNNGAPTAGTTKLYVKTDVGVYTDPMLTEAMTATSSIVLPIKTGWNFEGYYDYNTAFGTQNIKSDGSFVSTSKFRSVKNNTSENTTWYARWSRTCSAGTYFNANTQDCEACPAGKYCSSSNTVYNYTPDGTGITGTVAAGCYSNGGGITSVPTTSDGCLSGYQCGAVSAGYYSTHGGTSATPTGAGNGCLSEYQCGVVSAGYFSTGGGRSAEPNETIGGESGNGNNGCLSGYQCGKIAAGYYCEGGGKNAYPWNGGSASGAPCYGCTGASYSTGGATTCTNVSEGYHATGCDEGGNACTGQTPNEINIVWEAVAADATFDGVAANPNSNGQATSTVLYNGDIITPSKALVRTGQTFKGWKFSSN